MALQEPQESKVHLWLCREFETNLEYTKLYFKEQRAGSGEESWSSSLMASEGSGSWLSPVAECRFSDLGLRRGWIRILFSQQSRHDQDWFVSEPFQEGPLEDESLLFLTHCH